MKQKSITNILTIGFALFAMFFGAGNIILPPIIGLITGEDWSAAVSGFTITAIIAPFLGILAVLFSGDEFTDLGKRINETGGLILATMIILSIGPLVAIPRTAATTFEVGLLPVWPDFNPVISSVLFFAVTLVLSISPSKVVDIIGKYLTPLLLILLTIMIVLGVLHPLDQPIDMGVGARESFRIGFAEGYQTMDVLASVIYAGIIIAAVKAKGYTTQESKTKVTFLSGAVATTCLLFIYGGLVYLGATSGYATSGELKRTELLLYISNHVLGAQGTIALSICIALACLTTAIALVCATGTFFNQLTKGRVSYRVIVIATCIFSAVLAVNGVDQIIDYAGPFLGIIYPITLTLIVYVVAFGKRVKQKTPFVGAIVTTTIFSLVQFYIGMSIENATEDSCVVQLNEWIKQIPLYNYDVPWLLPSFVVFVLLYIIDRKK